LKRMNRRHTGQYYRDTIKRLRAARPGIAIGTDIIVGFCGETEAQFGETLSLYKECDFDISYPARYSTRSGTLATKIYEDNVSKEEKKRRWESLQSLMEEITFRKNQAYLGRRVAILVDDFSNGWCAGNTSEMKRARLKGDESLIGMIVRGEVFKAETWMLWAH